MSSVEDAIRLREERKFAEAMMILDDLRHKKRTKTDPVVLTESGIIYYQCHQIEQAEKFFKRSLEMGNDPFAYMYLALLENRNDSLEPAERFIDRGIRLSGDVDWLLWFVQGMIKLRLGKVKEARVSFKNTFDGSDKRTLSARLKLGHALGKEPPDWLKIGIVYEGLGRMEEAQHAYRIATKVTPEDAAAWIFLAETIQDEWEYGEVIREGRQHAPKNIELMLMEAESFYDFGMKLDAFRMFEEIPSPIAEEWVERLTEEFDEELDTGGYNHWLGEYGANDQDYYYDDRY